MYVSINSLLVMELLGCSDRIGHLRITFTLFLKASLGAHLSYENEISFICKFNSFSNEWLCTWPRFEREALGNSEMVYCCGYPAMCRGDSNLYKIIEIFCRFFLPGG